MSQTELFYALSLLQVEGVGDVMAKKLINQCGSAENIFKEKKATLQKIDGVGTFYHQKSQRQIHL